MVQTSMLRLARVSACWNRVPVGWPRDTHQSV